MEDPSFVTRAEKLYREAADRAPMTPEHLDDLCEEHPQLAPVLRQVDVMSQVLGDSGQFGEPSDDANSAPPAIPPTIPLYTIRHRLGAGGMGVVWAAQHDSLDRMVAIKVLRPQSEGGSVAHRDRERLLREARAMARIRHQHVVPVHDVIERGVVDASGASGGPAIVMEWVAGADFAEVLRCLSRDDTRARKPPPECGVGLDDLRDDSARAVHFAIKVANHVAQGLSAAHAAGVLHRDVKPSNIRIRAGDRDALLLDFGVARQNSDSDRTRGFVGTPEFAAPEQLHDGKVDVHADIYGLGRTLEFAVDKLVGFDSAREHEAVPRDLRAVIAKATEVDPRDRYASAAAMARDLAAVIAGEPVTARRRGVALRAAHWVIRDKLRIGLATAAVSAALLGTLLWLEWPHMTAGRTLAREQQVEDHLQRGFRMLLDPSTQNQAAAAFATAETLAVDDPATRREASLAHITALVMNDAMDQARAAAAARPELGQSIPELELLLADSPDATPRQLPPTPTRNKPARLATHALARYLLASRLNDPGAFAQAARSFEELLFVTPVARELHYGLMAYAAARADLHPTGINDEERRSNQLLLARAVAGLRTIWPNSATAYGWQALALEQRDPEAAEAAARRAMALDPTLKPYLRALAVAARMGHGDNTGARAELTPLLDQHPDDTRLLIVHGRLLARDGAAVPAIAAYRSVLDRAPDNLQAHGALSKLLWKSWDECMPHLLAMTELAPQLYVPWRNLGSAHMQQKQWREGRAALQRATQLAPRDGPSWAMLGIAEQKLDDPNAGESLRFAAELMPSNARASWSLAQWYVARDKLPDAVAALEEAARRLDNGGSGVRPASVETALTALRKRLSKRRERQRAAALPEQELPEQQTGGDTEGNNSNATDERRRRGGK